MANPFSPPATKWSTGDKLLPSLAASTATLLGFVDGVAFAAIRIRARDGKGHAHNCRLSENLAGLYMWEDHPLNGVGAGEYEELVEWAARNGERTKPQK